MSNNEDYIPFSKSPGTNVNNRGGWNNKRFTNRGPHQHHGSRNTGFRHGFSPYRGNGHRGFHNGPRFDKPADISAYYHPSMLSNPWAELEEKLVKKTENNSESLNSLKSESTSKESNTFSESSDLLSKSDSSGE